MNKWKHVVVGDVAAGSLKAAFSLDPSQEYAGQICNFRDDLSIGRIDRLMEGFEERFEWFSQLTEGTEFGHEIKESLHASLEEAYHDVLDFDASDRIVIWHSGIVSEEVTLSYLAYRYQAYDLWEVSITSQPLGRCRVEEVAAFIKETQRISPEDRVRYRQEWSALVANPATVRILRDGSILPVEENFYDAMLMDALRPAYQLAARVVGSVMGMTDQIVSDTFLDYRLRTLIRQGRLEAKGNLSALRFYQVRHKNETML